MTYCIYVSATGDLTACDYVKRSVVCLWLFLTFMRVIHCSGLGADLSLTKVLLCVFICVAEYPFCKQCESSLPDQSLQLGAQL